MKAEILAIGTELLIGQIANTNAQYISMRLHDMGINVYYHSVIGDNADRIKQALTNAYSRADLVIATGGLGPTKDDLTKQTISDFFGLKLVEDAKTVENLNNFFNSLNRPMTENNLRQALFPENSVILYNSCGTAPGCIIEKDGKTLVLLPGPPVEMKTMFEESVVPFFENRQKTILFSKFIKVFGIGESALESMIMDLIESQSNPTIAPYAKPGEVTLRLTANCNSNAEGEVLIEGVMPILRDRFGEFIYSETDESLVEVVVKLLKENNLKVAFAESCTGGLLTSEVVSVPGSSDVLDRSIVTYSNNSKIEEVNVDACLLEKYGAVSEQVALAMARGICAKSRTNIGVSVTGIAGPEGGSDTKPVGTVYVALVSDTKEYVKKLSLFGTRNNIRKLAVNNCLDVIRRYILNILN